MRRAARQDNTHKSIRDGLRKCGFSVADTSQLGRDFPDLLIGKNGLDVKVECKTPRGRKTALERFSEGQRTFSDEWKGSPVIAAYCLEDVLYSFSQLLRSKGWVR
jgi:Holliday junction resolvase